MGGWGDKGTRGQGDKGTRRQGDKGTRGIFIQLLLVLPSPHLPIPSSAPEAPLPKRPSFPDRYYIMEAAVVYVALTVCRFLYDIDKTHIPHNILRNICVAGVDRLGNGLVDTS